MTLFTLKIIAIITMFLDHYYRIIGGPEWLSILGRLAFPIFAFSISEGYSHTKNVNKYLMRLLNFAIIIQLPNFLGFQEYPLNIFFTLALGLFCLEILDNNKINIVVRYIVVLYLCFLAEKTGLDYGAYGVILIILFNKLRNNKLYIFIAFLALNLVILKIGNLSEMQIYSIFSLIPIFLYNGKKGYGMKYFFYLFYPLHFIFLYFLNELLGRMR
ncbi:MAG: conjugal transfer protein TraX [Leptotrichiaceae bacterium]|nr:conjugal transfer protein TraX [Leptotrichiaceae bacterium]MBP6168169.1 conjugal transfer protein TraX [Leptotrichiaceae bacterium]MBP7026642.1 conjugal transfer protein TraX [Leptotrichiaceae bacterium]MBP8637173.1 conjugal transfer protein TraX [Leptotrichiaceae bacterium]MBP9538996.1 conjugal transfer protein TraX [Leptotrichiaceae bacterium]